MSGPSGHLFVYGTLMTAAPMRMGTAQRERLAREGRTLGPATMAGRLIDLGRYPGLVEAARAGDVVHGELLLLADATRSLRWLDAYEGLVPGQHDHNEYVREERPAMLADGTAVTASVYVCQRAFTPAQLIEGGNWLIYVSTRGGASRA